MFVQGLGVAFSVFDLQASRITLAVCLHLGRKKAVPLVFCLVPSSTGDGGVWQGTQTRLLGVRLRSVNITVCERVVGPSLTAGPRPHVGMLTLGLS